MPSRFALRIESGDQAGETHAIASDGLTVGRRPGNDLVLRDASVSGRHARFSVEAGRVVLTDFGSTNGSFVEDKRVESSTLDGGAFLRLGKVECELVLVQGEAPAAAAMPAAAPPKPAPSLDDELEIELELHDDLDIEAAPMPAAAAPAASAPIVDGLDAKLLDSIDDDDDGMHQVDAAALAAAGAGRSKLPLIAGVLVLGGASAWYFMGMPGIADGDSNQVSTTRPVVAVAGNLIKDASFESGQAWDAGESAVVVPFVSDAWRFGGAQGLGVDLEAGESARVGSALTPLGRLRGLDAAAMVLVDGDGSARIGIEFSDVSNAHPTFTAYSAAFTSSEGDGEMTLSAKAPAGYDQARLILDFATGSGPGGIGFDDVSLVSGSDSAGVVSHGDFQMAPMGQASLALSFIDRPLLVGIAGSAPANVERGLTFTTSGLSLTLDPGLFAQGIATLGSGGYQPHGDAFTDAGVTSLVIGNGVYQMRLVTPGPVTMVGRPVKTGYRIEAKDAAGTCTLEIGFIKERGRAQSLDTKAQAAEKQGERGQALALWQELLDDVPFDRGLVLGSEAHRGRLIAAGLAEVGALRADLERAAFFGLADLYRECLAGVTEIRQEFAGSEVEPAALELAGEVRQALASVGLDDLAAARWDAARSKVLELTRAQGDEKLADHIQAAVNAAATGKENN